jgi:hypothetical protein
MKIMFSTRSKARAFAQKRTAYGIPTSVKDAGAEMKAQGKSRYYVVVLNK